MPSDILLKLILRSYEADKSTLQKVMDEAYISDHDRYWKLLDLYASLETAVQSQERSTG